MRQEIVTKKTDDAWEYNPEYGREDDDRTFYHPGVFKTKLMTGFQGAKRKKVKGSGSTAVNLNTNKDPDYLQNMMQTNMVPFNTEGFFEFYTKVREDYALPATC